MTTQPIPYPVAQPAPEPPAPEPAPLTVTAPPDSRLAQLQALFVSTKAAADEATKQHKAITDAIKVELTALNENERRFELTPAGDCPTLRVTYTVSNRFDSTRFKRDQPAVYETYLKPTGSWSIKAGS